MYYVYERAFLPLSEWSQSQNDCRKRQGETFSPRLYHTGGFVKIQNLLDACVS